MTPIEGLTAFTASVIIAITAPSTVACIRIPGIVANVEQSGNLPLDLNALRGQRLNWLLKVQDPDFYHHHGVDQGTPGAGYTPITQAVTKVLFFGGSFEPGFLR